MLLAHRTEKEITLRGRNIPNPIQYFGDYNFPDYVMAEIRRQGYEQPTPIQGQGWPISLQGRDFVGIAQVRMLQEVLLVTQRASATYKLNANILQTAWVVLLELNVDVRH